MAHKIVSPKFYLVNFAAITVLMILTVLVAKHPAFHMSDNPNGINLAIALLIAVMKAACIVSIFMGAVWYTPLVRLFALLGFVWLFILFLFVFTDYGFLNPMKEYGSPYGDLASPGAAPLAGGQGFAVHGLEEAPATGGHYVPPPHLFGHEVEGAEHGAEAGAHDGGAHEASGEETHGDH